MGSYLKSSADALQSVRAAPAVRGYVGAVALLDLAQYTSGMVIWLYVFARGGTAAISLLVITSSGTVAVLAAPMSGFADRYGRGRIAARGALLRAAVLLAMALSIGANGPVATTIVLAGLEGAVYSVGAPALRALAPTLVQSPTELSSVNLIISLGLALAIFLGPLVGGLAYELTGAVPVVIVVAAVFALSYPRLSRFQQESPPEDAAPATQEPHRRLTEALAGLRSAASERDIRLTLLVFCGYSFAVGILDVVLIVIARDVLHQSDGGAGALYAAFGVGGLVAGVGIGQLVRARLARVFGIAVMLWAVPIAGIAFVAQVAIAWVCAFFAGMAGTVAQAAGDTVLQRATPDRLMSRVLGAYETLTGIAYMVAALVPAILVSSIGARTVLALGATVAPLVVICCWAGLLQLDRDLDVDDERLKLVSSVPWLHTGSLAEQDRLASLLEEESAPAGEVILYQGETGVRFYILRSGAARVLVDGREVTRLRSGDWFGEVALLSDIPRTATVQATENSALLSLADEDFHRALAGAGGGARGESSHILGLQSLRFPRDLVWPSRDTGRAVPIPSGATIENSGDRVEVLSRLPLLAYLPTPAVVRIASASSIERRHPGEAILAEGAPPGDAYIIWEGHAQLSHHGRPRRIAGPGELIGELATLHGRPRVDSAVALDDAVLLRLPRDTLHTELMPVNDDMLPYEAQDG
ncbi:MAG TPA: MFS transporter [Solirubrobacteraceae bacterium]|nr:MFS transporter [Solirubrobacteraceae bacterium]